MMRGSLLFKKGRVEIPTRCAYAPEFNQKQYFGSWPLPAWGQGGRGRILYCINSSTLIATQCSCWYLEKESLKLNVDNEMMAILGQLNIAAFLCWNQQNQVLFLVPESGDKSSLIVIVMLGRNMEKERMLSLERQHLFNLFCKIKSVFQPSHSVYTMLLCGTSGWGNWALIIRGGKCWADGGPGSCMLYSNFASLCCPEVTTFNRGQGIWIFNSCIGKSDQWLTLSWTHLFRISGFPHSYYLRTFNKRYQGMNLGLYAYMTHVLPLSYNNSWIYNTICESSHVQKRGILQVVLE